MARKFIELKVGCMAKALDDEPTFVLLGRDICAPVAIRAWMAERIRVGKNTPCDPQIVEAQKLLEMMGAEQAEWHEASHRAKPCDADAVKPESGLAPDREWRDFWAAVSQDWLVVLIIVAGAAFAFYAQILRHP